MALSHSPKIPTSGLIACLDAANTKSYPGSGTTWTDLTGNGYDGTLVGSVTHTTDGNTSVFTLPGTTGNRIDMSGPNMASSDYTVICGTKSTGTQAGRVISAGANNWLLGHHGDDYDQYYAEGWINSPANNGGVAAGWRIYAGTGNITGDLYNLYSNGAAVVTGSTAGSAGPNGFSIGRYYSGDTQYTACSVSFLLVYDRVLSATEVEQVYQTYRGRFGI